MKSAPRKLSTSHATQRVGQSAAEHGAATVWRRLWIGEPRAILIDETLCGEGLLTGWHQSTPLNNPPARDNDRSRRAKLRWKCIESPSCGSSTWLRDAW